MDYYNWSFFIAALFFLACGGYVYISVRMITGSFKSKLHREHLAAVVCVVFSSLFYGLMTIAENESALWFFWAAGYISYFMFLPAWIRFTSNMFTIKHKVTKRMVRSVLIIISLLLSVTGVLSGNVVFVDTKYGNQFSFDGSLFFKIIGIYVFMLCILVFVSHIRWWRESKMERQRVQQQRFLILTFLFAPIGFITDFVIPAFTSSTVTPLVSILLFPAGLQLYISMQKNKTLNITAPNVS